MVQECFGGVRGEEWDDVEKGILGVYGGEGNNSSVETVERCDSGEIE